MIRFTMGARPVGDGAPCFVIAEAGLAHDGSLGQAHACIDACAETGVDAVKFQLHIAAEESTLDEAFRVNVFPQDPTRYAYWERTAFTEAQWRQLKAHAEARGLVFLCSPFSGAAVRLLRRLGVSGWKIGSGETSNLLLMREVAAGGEPVLLSSGMSTWHELDTVVELLKSAGVPLAVLQCTSRYPCPPEHLGLQLVPGLAARYGVPSGFSDHSGTVAAGLAAVALGAKILEVHVTWHPRFFGPDVSSSLTIEQLAELVRGVRLIEAALARPVDKDASSRELQPMRRLFTKGLIVTEDLPAGARLELHHLEARKPCDGIPASEYQLVLGRSLVHPLQRGSRIVWADLA